jgi:2-C-methyl-D-erythritol 4-phosphate cytidylyltransferase
MRVSAVILAAGRGDRMKTKENKIYLPVGGRPLLFHALSAFALSQCVAEVILVVQARDEERARDLLNVAPCPVHIVPGGATRRDSAEAGVEAASEDVILIHDGARPFPSSELIGRVVDGAVHHNACVPILPVVDTLRYVTNDAWMSDRLVSRIDLVRVQTPQGFRTSLIRRCFAEDTSEVTDDAGIALACGEPVWTVPGEPFNLKVTTPRDFELAEAICLWLGRFERPAQ